MPSCHQSPTNCGSQAMCPYILRMVSSRGCAPLHLRPFRDSPNEVERCPQGPKEAQLFRRMNELHVVTGAFGYSGRYIAARLLAAGHRVRTLTNSPKRPNPFGDRVEALPFNFDRPDRLTASLDGASVLYNTYWVRFNYSDFRYTRAVENTRVLFNAARAAGVWRVVHVSITNPSENS